MLQHKKWIEKHLAVIADKKSSAELSDDEIAGLKAAAKAFIPERTEYYAEILGVKPTGIRITSAAKRYGSCSSRNSLCFSYRLMLHPKEQIDYVIVHELAHIKEHNHSPAFYKIIARYMPDYKDRIKALRRF